MTNSDTPISQFIALAGDIAEAISFNRSIGQLYGYLYLSPEPRSLEDIAKTCSMSKGNASVQLRILESWGAVHHSTQPGTRKDYYTANTNLEQIALRRLHEGLGKRLEDVRYKLSTLKNHFEPNDPTQDPVFEQWITRRKDIERLLNRLEKGLKLIPQLDKLSKFLD